MLIQSVLFIIGALLFSKHLTRLADNWSEYESMDRIIVFDQGKIVEDGTHIELLRNNGLYKILWDAQVGGFLSSVAYGYIVDRFESYDAPFIPMAALLFLGTLLWLRIDASQELSVEPAAGR